MSTFVLLKLTASDCGACIRLKSNWTDELTSEIEKNNVKVISHESPSLSIKLDSELIPKPIIKIALVYPLLILVRRSYWEYLFSHPDDKCNKHNLFILGPYLNDDGVLSKNQDGRIDTKFEKDWNFSSSGILKWITDMIGRIPYFQLPHESVQSVQPVIPLIPSFDQSTVQDEVKKEEFCGRYKIRRRR